MDKRKQTILKALITDYISTCEPVASNRLVSFYDFDVKSATIRSELNELATLGFLIQPHKSGGRIPTDLGYRYYVDNLLENINLNGEILKIVSKALKNKAEIEALIKSATQMLSDITGFVSVASFPKINNSKLKYIGLSDYSHNKKLFILAFSNGYILHKIIDFTLKDKIYSLENAINHLLNTFYDKEVSEILTFKTTPSVYEDITKLIINIVKEYFQNFNSSEYSYEGVGKILKYPEFKDLNKLQSMLIALEDKNILDDIFKWTEEKITVKIGSENSHSFMKDYSLISCKYTISNIPSGVIGIIGPKRMDYAMSIAGVEIISKNLSSMLTNLSSK